MALAFHRSGKGSRNRDKNRAYVSEFESFISHFLDEHPEVKAEQRSGFYLYWDKKVDLAAVEKAEEDSVPDDRYGFDYSSWHHEQTARDRSSGSNN